MSVTGEGGVVIVVYPCATSLCKIHRPTGNKSDIELGGHRSPRRSVPARNTLGWGRIVWGENRVASDDAMGQRCEQVSEITRE